MADSKAVRYFQAEVWEAYKRVKANQGAAGVDGQSIADVRGGSGGQPLQALESPGLGELFSAAGPAGGDPQGRASGDKTVRHSDGGGPGGSDGGRMVPGAGSWSRHFHPDSYGYRPGKSALEAVGVAPAAMLAVRLGARPRYPGSTSIALTMRC